LAGANQRRAAAGNGLVSRQWREFGRSDQLAAKPTFIVDKMSNQVDPRRSEALADKVSGIGKRSIVVERLFWAQSGRSITCGTRRQ
jgi:hypothetical protein